MPFMPLLRSAAAACSRPLFFQRLGPAGVANLLRVTAARRGKVCGGCPALVRIYRAMHHTPEEEWSEQAI